MMMAPVELVVHHSTISSDPGFDLTGLTLRYRHLLFLFLFIHDRWVRGPMLEKERLTGLTASNGIDQKEISDNKGSLDPEGSRGQ
jgi:hypothetical protein